MDISKAWGYGAVIFPRDLEWQGFVVLDPKSEEMRPHVGHALAVAERALGLYKGDASNVAVEGFLSAAMAGALIKGNEAGVGIFASALSTELDARFWVVETFREPGGKSTTAIKLEVSTPEEARAEINKRVEPLQLLRQMRELLTARKST